MIIDSLKNASLYTNLHPLFARAFDYLKNENLNALEDGTTDLGGGLKVIVSSKKGKTPEESLSKFECHDQNIEIQFCVKGVENIGWKPREKCTLPNGDYNPEKDVRFYKDSPDMYFQLTDNQFVIFYPNDVHAPMIGNDIIKKIVFKVKI